MERFLDQNRKATAQFNNISYYCTDVMDLEFEPESFDFVFMNWLLMYLDDQQMTLLRDRIHLWTRVGGSVFLRESCFVGSTGGQASEDSPARYRPDSQYARLFEDDFRLVHKGNVKVYEQRFNNPYQCYWLFQRNA
jgi:phosphoethanolamine N-methyltransferase